MAFAAAAQTLGAEAAGLTREQVLELETALAQLNFDPGEIDGVIDDRTHAAIRLYQDFAALPADAKATPALLAEVLSVARSFAEMRATRAPDPVPDVSSSDTLEAPAEPRGLRREPDPPKVAATKVPDEVPNDIPASAPAAPEVDSEQAAEPEAVEPPKKPEVETSKVQQSPPKPRSAPKDPDPAGNKATAGYNIGSVISRLVETGTIADRLAEPDSAAAPDAVPPSGPAGNGQIARVPASAPALARTPDGPIDGYTAFQDAYKAAQAGDFEYAVQRYTDAIESKKLTLEHLGDAHFNRANVLHLLGRYDKSIADYGVTIGVKPNFAGAYYNRGFAYRAKGDRQQAVDDFRRARDLGLQRLGVRAPDRSPPLR